MGFVHWRKEKRKGKIIIATNQFLFLIKGATPMFNRLLLKEYCAILLLWLLQFRQVIELQRFFNREVDWPSIDPSLPSTRT
jgi:hypothetical protein